MPAHFTALVRLLQADYVLRADSSDYETPRSALFRQVGQSDIPIGDVADDSLSAKDPTAHPDIAVLRLHTPLKVKSHNYTLTRV